MTPTPLKELFRSIRASKTEALRDPTTHKWVPQLGGYLRVGPLQTFGTFPAARCYPPAGTTHKTWHALQPPNGHPPIEFLWSETTKTWITDDRRSNRLGYAPEYLSSHGWTYLVKLAGPSHG